MYGRGSEGGEERRRNTNTISFTEEQLETIATRAAQIALDKIYGEIGKGVVKKFAWLTGVIIISVFIWLAQSGKLNL